MQILNVNTKKLIFNTKQFKQSYRDLCQNPNIEICFYNHNSYEQIRIYRQVKEINDIELKKQIFKNLDTIIKHASVEERT